MQGRLDYPRGLAVTGSIQAMLSVPEVNPTAVFIIIEPVGLSGIDRLLAEALRVCSCKLLRIPTCLPLTT